MARTLRDSKLDTRSARKAFAIRREPYWRSLSPGFAIGYRKLAVGGSWIARQYRPGAGRRYCALGAADDVAEADGANILSFAQAQAAARTWLEKLSRSDRNETDVGPYTINAALDDYLADYERRGGKAKGRVENAMDAHIRPALGALQISALTRRRIEAWHTALANIAPRIRTEKTKRQRHRDKDTSAEGVRRRKSTANRILTILKAALNHAHHNRRADAAEVWQAVKPFREVDAPKIRYLSDAESKRLVNACPPGFRRLVTAALLTGARYGELAALAASDFSLTTAERSTSGRARAARRGTSI